MYLALAEHFLDVNTQLATPRARRPIHLRRRLCWHGVMFSSCLHDLGDREFSCAANRREVAGVQRVMTCTTDADIVRVRFGLAT